MELPPPHVLAQLDAIIVGQESSIVANDEGDLQNVDDDRSVSSEALGISSSATSFKWRNHSMFPGRVFDDLDEYRAAKKQRAEQRAAYSDQLHAWAHGRY